MSTIAERSILATMLFDSDKVPQIVSQLSPGDFGSSSHAKLFTAMVNVHREHGTVDAVLLAEVKGLDIKPLLELGNVPVYDPLHIEVIKTNASKRNLNLLLRSGLVSLEDGQSVEQVLAPFKDYNPDTGPALSTTGWLVNNAFSQIENHSREVISTGIPAVDRVTGGLQPGETWCIAARTSQGKSTMALAIAEGVARQPGCHVFFVSAEGGEFDTACRMLARHSQVANFNIRTGRLKEFEYPRLVEAAREISELPMSFLHREYSWDRIKFLIESRKQEDPDIKLFVLDYIGLLNAPVENNLQRYLEVGRITQESKRLAERLNVTAILVAQLNRNLDMRKDPVPKLSDLRESGNIEQDCDLVMFLHNPTDSEEDVELIVAKNRNGPVGSTGMKFNRPTLSFSETL